MKYLNTSFQLTENKKISFNIGYSKNEEIPFRIAKSPTFYKPVWFDLANEEYTACREGVGLIDYSSYTKIDLWVREY